MRSLATTMTILFVIAFGLVSHAYSQSPYSQSVMDSETYVCKSTTGKADSIYVLYHLPSPARLANHSETGFSAFRANTTVDSVNWTCVWYGDTLSDGETATLGVEFLLFKYENAIAKGLIFWKDGPLLVGGHYGPGFTVTPAGGAYAQITYTVKNSTTSRTFTVDDLQLKISADETALQDMIYPLAGFDTPREPITLGPGVSHDVTLNPAIPPPYYVLAQGIVKNAAQDSIKGYFVHQHYHPTGIPTLTMWGLFVLLLLIVTAGVVVVRRRRRTAEL